jgi:hypothetical protein
MVDFVVFQFGAGDEFPLEDEEFVFRGGGFGLGAPFQLMNMAGKRFANRLLFSFNMLVSSLFSHGSINGNLLCPRGKPTSFVSDLQENRLDRGQQDTFRRRRGGIYLANRDISAAEMWFLSSARVPVKRK